MKYACEKFVFGSGAHEEFCKVAIESDRLRQLIALAESSSVYVSNREDVAHSPLSSSAGLAGAIFARKRPRGGWEAIQ